MTGILIPKPVFLTSRLFSFIILPCVFGTSFFHLEAMDQVMESQNEGMFKAVFPPVDALTSIEHGGPLAPAWDSHYTVAIVEFIDNTMLNQKFLPQVKPKGLWCRQTSGFLKSSPHQSTCPTPCQNSFTYYYKHLEGWRGGKASPVPKLRKHPKDYAKVYSFTSFS